MKDYFLETGSKYFPNGAPTLDETGPTRLTMPVTLKQICEEAGVSKATVSRVLNNHPLVSRETREKVQAVIKRLHFTPNALARNLSLRKTDTIGVIFPWIFSGFFSTVLLGIDTAASQHNYHVITSLFHDKPDEKDVALNLLQERRVDGLILMGPNISHEKIVELQNQNIPCVVLQQEIQEPDVSFVSVDNFDGGYQATAHLLQRGYRKILAIAGPVDSQDSNRREEGFKAALKEAGIKFDSSMLIRSEFNKETALPNFELHRHQSPMPEAVFCFNDDIALGLLKYLKEIKVRVPEDVAVMGFDGIEFTDFAELSTVQTPMKEMGEQAVRLIVKQLENKENRIAEKWLLKGTVVARNSTAPKSAR
jgi:DNA-binding LacI/PurR family transcriptional regulator